MAFFCIILHFSLQTLKSIHLVCLSFRDMSCDPEFRILISVQKMCPYIDCHYFLFNLNNASQGTDKWFKWKLEKYVTIICLNDDLSLSLTWLDFLQNSEGFILFTEINQILLEISFIPILLPFTYPVALHQNT